MTNGAELNQDAGADGGEPITLTDSDGAVTRVAPWSTWTREQVRAPGGEPALVTRLDAGTLWFSAGRRRSPWRHEVHVGNAVVTTPQGRFQAVAEADGGSTVSCLAGRVRIQAGLREPVLIGQDQSASISADGHTLVVMDRPADRERIRAALSPAAAGAEAGAADEGGGHDLLVLTEAPAPEGTLEESPAPAESESEDRTRPIWPRRVAEVVAVTALVALLVAVVVVGGGGGEDRPADQALGTAGTPTSAVPITTGVPSTAAPTTEASPAETPTSEPAPTQEVAAPTTEALAPAVPGVTGTGRLSGCRRAEGGVAATVEVAHTGGPDSRFQVSVGVVDGAGVLASQGQATTEVVPAGASTVVEVLIPVTGTVTGSCEVVRTVGV